MYGYKDNPAFVVNEICSILKIDKKGIMVKVARKEYSFKGVLTIHP
jgi:hypothetical protein